MKRLIKFGLFPMLLLGGIYAIGPKPSAPVLDARIAMPTASQDLTALEQQINDNERTTPNLKPDNQARIIWADSIHKTKTKYVVVYLPGFGATYQEGYPLNVDFAKLYGANLYLPRLWGHGTESKDNLLGLTPENLLASAKEAVATATQLGEKVILMGTSTGGTLGLLIAAQNPDLIHSMYLYSPNIAIANGAAFLMDNPWGLAISRVVHQGDYHSFDAKDMDDYALKYWTCRYRIEALVALESLLEHGMTTATFNKVKCPILVGAYYKNDESQDKVVSVAAMDNMFDNVATPKEQKLFVKFPEAATHVIACKMRSKSYDDVAQSTFEFADKLMR